MRTKQLWAFIDNKTNDILGMVMTVTHEKEVERIAMDALSNPNSVLRRYPQDFTLRQIAIVEMDENGVSVTPRHVDVNVVELAEKTEIDYQRAAEEEAEAKRAQAAYEHWVRSQQEHGKTPTQEELTLLQRIMRGIKG